MRLSGGSTPRVRGGVRLRDCLSSLLLFVGGGRVGRGGSCGELESVVEPLDHARVLVGVQRVDQLGEGLFDLLVARPRRRNHMVVEVLVGFLEGEVDEVIEILLGRHAPLELVCLTAPIGSPCQEVTSVLRGVLLVSAVRSGPTLTARCELEGELCGRLLSPRAVHVHLLDQLAGLVGVCRLQCFCCSVSEMSLDELPDHMYSAAEHLEDDDTEAFAQDEVRQSAKCGLLLRGNGSSGRGLVLLLLAVPIVVMIVLLGSTHALSFCAHTLERLARLVEFFRFCVKLF